jgi:hypothetical protein
MIKKSFFYFFNSLKTINFSSDYTVYKYLSGLDYAFKQLLKKNGFKTENSHNRNISFVELFLQISFEFFVSFFSFLIFIIFKRNRIGIWTSDYYDNQTKGDFRLGDLYIDLDKNSTDYIEFVHRNPHGLKNVINNFFKRKRLVIYTRCFDLLISKFNNSNFNYEKKLKEYYLNYDKYFSQYHLYFWSWILKKSGVTTLMPWELSSRQANLIFAAKLNKIKIIGFMHGAGMKEYMIHEFANGANLDNSIFDSYGVWSEWWKNYYANNSYLYKKIDVIGFPRYKNIKLNTNNIKNVLFIEEPLSNTEELICYWEKISKMDLDFGLKIRKGTHTNFKEKISKHLKISKYFTESLTEAYEWADIVIGSHSTAVIEASMFNKHFLLLDTPTWGNYYNLDSNYIINNTSNLNMIFNVKKKQNLNIISTQFFGSHFKNNWLINEILRSHENTNFNK